MPGLVPIRCDGYEVTQAPGTVVYSDSQNKLPCQVPESQIGEQICLS